MRRLRRATRTGAEAGASVEGPAGSRERADARDVRLVLAARAGDDQALHDLLADYRGFAWAKARSYFLIGADREDVVQEGMIGLYKAVRDFDPAQQASFRSFADLCVTRQIQSAVKSANRHKHSPLNGYLSLSGPVGGAADDQRTVADVLPGPATDDPAEVVVSAERIRALAGFVEGVLSDLETEVLRLYVDGKSYVEIAGIIDRQVKAVDNALQRVKRKIEDHLSTQALADAG